MRIICVSMGTYGGAKDLAQNLSEKMGYPCLCREDLVEAATREGIQVGKLEMSTIKPRVFTQRLARERDHYLAFSRAFLCEQALKGDLIYYGRTGHLLLPGVSHVLRVRVVLDLEHRIQAIVERMGSDREKALRYIREVDEDRARWARSMYGISVEEPINYDITINLQDLSVGNAATSLVAMAQLPDFQMTPASEKALRELHLGAVARLALARDRRTHFAALNVRADNGVVTVGYHPQDSDIAAVIPEVLESVEGVGDVRITMATANMLWIQESFSPTSTNFDEVVQIATKWNAAVELMRLASEDEDPSSQCGLLEIPATQTGSRETIAYNGGIEDDTPDTQGDDKGLRATLDELARVGRSGGGGAVFGGRQKLVEVLGRHIPYTLVVIGNVFLSKGHAAKLRPTRDLGSYLGDHIKAPVVTADELGSQYLFGRRDLVRTSLLVAVVVAIYWLVFAHQETILAFLANSGWYAEATEGTFLGRFGALPKLIVSLVVLGVIPVIAVTYGKVASAVLKWIKIE